MNERERANTTYYDAQSNFGTPPKDGSGDYRSGMVSRKNTAEAEQEVLYERIHKEQRYNQYQRRDSPQKVVSVQTIVRSPNSNGMISRMSSSGGPVHMPPMSSSHDYSSGVAGRAKSGSDEPRWPNDDFKPGPRANSAANIDALFHKNKWQSTSTTVTQLPPAPRREYMGGPVREEANTAQLMFVRRNRDVVAGSSPKSDFGVVGAYSQDNAHRADQIMYGRSGTVRQHGHEYELDPRLNVSYPQYYVDDWKDRHARDNGFVPRHNSSFNKAHPPPQQVPRPRFASDASNNRHVYEEVPMGGHYESANGYGRSASRQDEQYRKDKETAILDDYDNVPNEFLNNDKSISNVREEDANFDENSDVYQPGRYQPCKFF